MPDTGHFTHEIVDAQGNFCGLGGNAHKLHTAGIGKKTCPEQVVFAGQHTELFGPLSVSLFNQIQRKVQVFLCGGGFILHNKPAFIDAHGGQVVEHALGFG